MLIISLLMTRSNNQVRGFSMMEPDPMIRSCNATRRKIEEKLTGYGPDDYINHGVFPDHQYIARYIEYLTYLEESSLNLEDVLADHPDLWYPLRLYPGKDIEHFIPCYWFMFCSNMKLQLGLDDDQLITDIEDFLARQRIRNTNATSRKRTNDVRVADLEKEVAMPNREACFAIDYAEEEEDEDLRKAIEASLQYMEPPPAWYGTIPKTVQEIIFLE